MEEVRQGSEPELGLARPLALRSSKFSNTHRDSVVARACRPFQAWRRWDTHGEGIVGQALNGANPHDQLFQVARDIVQAELCGRRA